MKAEPRNPKKSSAPTPEENGLWLFLQQHANKLLFGVILILLIYILVRNHQATVAQRRVSAETSLSTAEAAIHYLGRDPQFLMAGSPESLASLRRSSLEKAQLNLDEALKAIETPELRARLEVDRGDLNWHLANFPVLPGADTQPAKLGTQKTQAEYLAAAESAYLQVLDAPLSENKPALCTARIGLAAIAENRGQWDEASKRYQQVIDDSTTDKSLIDYAKKRQTLLATLKRPVLLASGAPSTAPSPYIVPEAPTTGPTTRLTAGPTITGTTNLTNLIGHATLQPVTLPTTGPTTSAVEPAPTTAPASPR